MDGWNTFRAQVEPSASCTSSTRPKPPWLMTCNTFIVATLGLVITAPTIKRSRDGGRRGRLARGLLGALQLPLQDCLRDGVVAHPPRDGVAPDELRAAILLLVDLL